MFREEKNLKDTQLPLPNLPLTKGEEQGWGLSYTKTNKLITALYMVTDMIDKDEPLRNKLRTLGIEIISDMNSIPVNALNKIANTVSFLDLATTVNIISEMNCNILRKEFLELNNSIKESANKFKGEGKQINLSEFLKEEESQIQAQHSIKDKHSSNGHITPTRIGVQKGSTLLKAIKNVSDRGSDHVSTGSFDILKKQRRGEIINLIQKRGGSATITDIKNSAYGSLTSCGEKTLQRELVSMVKDGVLNKTGEKRWSRYFIK